MMKGQTGNEITDNLPTEEEEISSDLDQNNPEQLTDQTTLSLTCYQILVNLILKLLYMMNSLLMMSRILIKRTVEQNLLPQQLHRPLVGDRKDHSMAVKRRVVCKKFNLLKKVPFSTKRETKKIDS